MGMKSITDGTEDFPRGVLAAGRTVTMGEMATTGKMSSIGRKAAAGGKDTLETGPMRKRSISGELHMTMGKEQEAEGADTTRQIPAAGCTMRRKTTLRVPSTTGTAKLPDAGIPVSSGLIPLRIPSGREYHPAGITSVGVPARAMGRKHIIPALAMRRRTGIPVAMVRKADIRAVTMAMKIEVLVITVRKGGLLAVIMTGKMAVPVIMARKTDILTVVTTMRTEALAIAARKTDTPAMILAVRTEMPGHPAGARKIFRQEDRREAGSSFQKRKPRAGRRSPVRRIIRWQKKQRNLKTLKRKSGKRSIAC